jgi:predicted nucleotidyltransferase
MKQVNHTLEAFVESYSNILKTNLIGIFLHGSLAMGCFNPESSDIDILVVVEKDISFNEKRKLVDLVLKLSNESSKNDFEISVILKEDANSFKYPTPFILHYSSMYKERYINDPGFICGNGIDPDLSSHITIIIERGICLFGKQINQVFGPIPKEYYIKSIIGDIESAKESIVETPVYYILNLCRVLYYLREGVICSKKDGGEWGLFDLPEQYREVIKSALLTYEDAKNVLQFEPQSLAEFANFTIGKIEEEYDVVMKKLL